MLIEYRDVPLTFSWRWWRPWHAIITDFRYHHNLFIWSRKF